MDPRQGPLQFAHACRLRCHWDYHVEASPSGRQRGPGDRRVSLKRLSGCRDVVRIVQLVAREPVDRHEPLGPEGGDHAYWAVGAEVALGVGIGRSPRLQGTDLVGEEHRFAIVAGVVVQLAEGEGRQRE